MASHTIYARFGKRCFDVCLSAVALVLLAPLWIVVALSVLLCFGRPVLVQQERLGLGGQSVRLLSFRLTPSLHGEPPTCWLGRFLQRSGLEALPRLWNVLRGDLSIVGPESRPIRDRYRGRKSRRLPLTVRPGLCVVEESSAAASHECSPSYAEQCSFLFDLRVLIRALALRLRRDGVKSKDASSAARDSESQLQAMETLSASLASTDDLMSRFGTMRIISPDQEAEWMDVVRSAGPFDYYHLPSYHRLAESRGEGKPLLFAYREGQTIAALPLLLRPLDAMPWAASDSPGMRDATSVYGYAGPIASKEAMEPHFAGRFRRALADALVSQRVVSVFSRLDPMLDQLPLVHGLGQAQEIGKTVSIDVTQSDEQLLAKMHRTHRKDISALRRSGARFAADESLQYLESFAEAYHGNMHRVHAAPHYRFPLDYFEELCRDRDHVKLLLIRKGDTLACGGLFLHTGDLVQYHLCGTAHEHLAASPAKLLIFAACGWARERGAKRLHLGGGLGGSEDSLFRFKQRFGGDVHPFHVWRWIVDPKAYRRCCELHSQQERPAERLLAHGSFFPAYRRPLHVERAS